jgi:SAM-dependent methyltransferase
VTGPLAPGADDIGPYLVSSRSFDEYRAMFDLTDDDLDGRVLDCPGGGAGFTAIAHGLGVRAVAADPAYATPPEELVARLRDELERGSAWTRAHAGRYTWTAHAGPDQHARVRAEAAALFAGDLLARPGGYVAAALPELPFADDSFDLVLSSHLLFTYADRIDAAAHEQALRELLRVCRGRVLVYPMVDQAGRAVPDLVDRLMRTLSADGVRARVRETGYDFQRGARHLLELSR